jgi:hypothetical protein
LADDHASQLRELFGSLVLFFQRRAKQSSSPVITELKGKATDASAARHFVMIQSVGSSNDREVVHAGLQSGAHPVFALRDHQLHNFRFASFGTDPQTIDDLFKSAQVNLRLVQSVSQCGPQLSLRSRLGHFWQGAHELVFGVVEISQLFDVKLE